MSLSTIATILAALAFVITLLAGARQLATRLNVAQILSGNRGTTGTLTIEQVLTLDTRRRLLLIRCHERQLLLLTGGPKDILVGWVDTRA